MTGQTGASNDILSTGPRVRRDATDFNVPRADRHCTHCDQFLMGDEIHFLYECPKLNNLRIKYMYSPDIRREPNVFNFVNIMQTNDPVTIGNLAKFILHGLKLYT